MTMSTLVRLEYLTPEGWKVGHAGIALVDPQRYVERLAGRKKYGRALELDDKLQPSGRTWEPGEIPDDLNDLVPSSTSIPKLREPEKECPLCETEHRPPFDGRCLL